MSNKKKLTQEEKDRRFYRRAWLVLAGFFRFVMRIHPNGAENVPAEELEELDELELLDELEEGTEELAEEETFEAPAEEVIANAEEL